MKKIVRIFGSLIVASFIMFAAMPANLVYGDTSGGFIAANYEVVNQGIHNFRIIVNNSIGEARAYLFQGINGALGDYVAFIYPLRYNSNWRINSAGYQQTLVTFNGEYPLNVNDYGSFSPYPRNGGSGYYDSPNNVHNGIGSALGAFVEVSTAMKYDDWLVETGSSGTYHWVNHIYEGGEEGTWDHAAIGAAFHFRSNTHFIKAQITSWEVVTGWWIFEKHYDMLGGEHRYVYLYTAGGITPI